MVPFSGLTKNADCKAHHLVIVMSSYLSYYHLFHFWVSMHKNIVQDKGKCKCLLPLRQQSYFAKPAVKITHWQQSSQRPKCKFDQNTAAASAAAAAAAPHAFLCNALIKCTFKRCLKRIKCKLNKTSCHNTFYVLLFHLFIRFSLSEKMGHYTYIIIRKEK